MYLCSHNLKCIYLPKPFTPSTDICKKSNQKIPTKKQIRKPKQLIALVLARKWTTYYFTERSPWAEREAMLIDSWQDALASIIWLYMLVMETAGSWREGERERERARARERERDGQTEYACIREQRQTGLSGGRMWHAHWLHLYVAWDSERDK